ncbi:MAG: TrkH family potassium uptake protein [Firmicutes bacterium]|nr:TrkH family potassium uptake protein [Bacillota bacterium]
MRTNVILTLLGRLIFFLGIAMLLPLFWSLLFSVADVQVFLISVLCTCLLGLILFWKRPLPDDLSLKEGFTFVTLAWICAAFFGCFPYLLSGTLHNFVDAFFESMSGFSTTGATVIEDIEIVPQGILLWRSFTQWLGGMGIIALFVALMPRLGYKGGSHLLRAEIPGPDAEKVVPRVTETAKALWFIYVVLTCLELILLLLSGFSFFDALNHTLTTMPSGGFSTKNASIGFFSNSVAEVIIIAFMLMTGTNFTLYYNFWKGNKGAIFRDEEFRFYLMVIFVAVVFITINTFPGTYSSLTVALRKGTFQVISILTSTGYSTDNFDQWPPLSKAILIALMFIGSCGGSTGGGMKQIRILIIMKYCYRELQKIIHPTAVISLRVGEKRIPEETVQAIIGFSFFYFILIVINTLIMAALGLDLVSAFSISAATLGNVGPALGLVGPTQTYAAIPAVGKIVLSFIMLVGRLEIFTVLILLLPELRSFSLKKRNKIS